MSLWNPQGSNWDTAANWGRTPRLAAPAATDDTTITVTGLGTGTLPAGAVFFLGGSMYSLTADAAIGAGTAVFSLDSGLAADAATDDPLTDTNALACDGDLTDQDSAIIGLAKKIIDPVSGKSAYDGKRGLVKRDIATWLERREYSPAGVTYPWQFNRAAVLLELAYIYGDLARRNEGIANEKSELYTRMYQEEIESLEFAYTAPATTSNSTFIRTTAIMWRA